MNNIAVALLFFLAIASGYAQEKLPLDSKLNQLQLEIKGVKETIKNYRDVELRSKETNNALAELNKKLSEMDGELARLNGDLKAVKDRPARNDAVASSGSARSDAYGRELTQKLSIMETEIELIKQELARTQEKISIDRSYAEQKKNSMQAPKQDSNSDFKETISSPWVGFIALVISIVALIRP